MKLTSFLSQLTTIIISSNICKVKMGKLPLWHKPRTPCSTCFLTGLLAINGITLCLEVPDTVKDFIFCQHLILQIYEFQLISHVFIFTNLISTRTELSSSYIFARLWIREIAVLWNPEKTRYFTVADTRLCYVHGNHKYHYTLTQPQNMVCNKWL